ncbi:glutathione S-transferase 1 isoform X1 [Aegilops tauschii subsp. strangulata]|nr:glutathione S-transferase 1 isoform X1 [Aegilops tauschii subsp. strangulata]
MQLSVQPPLLTCAVDLGIHGDGGESEGVRAGEIHLRGAGAGVPGRGRRRVRAGARPPPRRRAQGPRASRPHQSRAISRYVLRKGASDLLRENSLAESATVDAWLEAESHNFDRAMSAITFQCFVVPMFMGGTTDHKIVEENMEKLKAALGVYEERLTRFKYLAGDFISLADLSHCPMAHYLLASPCASVLDAYPRVKDWVDGMMDRPSVKKVMELMDAS